jgi:hypothetical protein
VIGQRFILHSNEQELIMSARNGDKSRFHRERKQKIARRKRNQGLLPSAGMPQKPAVASARVKPQTVAQ